MPGPADLLAGELHLVGRITTASNVALLARVGDPPRWALYKPVRGERPLWDFPEGTLAARERAAYLVSEAGGWHLVPPTVMREGPLGVGSVQAWIEDPYASASPPSTDGEPAPAGGLAAVVDVVPVGGEPAGWLPVLTGEDEQGRPVRLVHEDRDDLRSMAVFDAAINNSDRKGSHCARDGDGRLWGFDHAVSFHPDPKLRTVLWGWQGRALADADLARLTRLGDALAGGGLPELADLLPEPDLDALRQRVERLLTTGRHPAPAPGWPAIPWPAL